MPPEHVNRGEVERRTGRLLDEFGDVPVEEHTREAPADRFEELLAGSRDGYLGGAYVWVVRRPEDAPPLTESMPEAARQEADRALLILNRAADRWGLPGGGQEDDERFEETAVREVREETGVDCELTDLFLLRRVETTSAGDHDQHLHVLRAFFDGRYRGGSVSIQPGELNGAAWFVRPPARMGSMTERRANRFFED